MGDTMKKIKILFCGLLIGLSVLSYLIVTQKKSTSELLLLNVDALGQDESGRLECVYAPGLCPKNGYIPVGMRYFE